MCGIAGFVGNGSSGILETMTDALRHRGPDDRGLWTGKGAGLGHARLAIIDVSVRGHQPMWNNVKTVVIVLNGEIYNYRELKAELQSEYQFQSDSDTEVILALYEKFGEGAFQKLSGMFSIALYDTVRRELYLVRDRLGEKPLYYTVVKSTIVFASEIKSLLKHLEVKAELDEVSLAYYLHLEYVPTPRTLFKGISKLEPGSYLKWSEGKAVIQPFWALPREVSHPPTLTESIEELNTRLRNAVQSQLVADVPVGVFLSGGIDSSTIAYYAQLGHSEKIQTFSISFDEPSFDESSYAELVARHLGTDHHVRRVSSSDALKVVPKLPDLFDEPVADPSVIPTYILSGFARESVTVALGGDGGDELFAGYPTFQAEYLHTLLSSVPASMRDAVLLPLVHTLPVSERNFGFSFKAEKFIEGMGRERFLRHSTWLGAFSPEDISELAPGLDVPSLRPPLTEGMEHVYSALSPLNQLLFFYARTYLLDEVLVKVDRASMAHALEVRAPFLDRRVVEYAYSLPDSYKLRFGTTKYLLKKLMLDKLPSAVISRPKKGFGIPLSRWLRGELKEFLTDTLSASAVDSWGLFGRPYVEKLIGEHLEGRRDHRKKLWTLLMLFQWKKKYLS